MQSRRNSCSLTSEEFSIPFLDSTSWFYSPLSIITTACLEEFKACLLDFQFQVANELSPQIDMSVKPAVQAPFNVRQPLFAQEIMGSSVNNSKL